MHPALQVLEYPQCLGGEGAARRSSPPGGNRHFSPGHMYIRYPPPRSRGIPGGEASEFALPIPINLPRRRMGCCTALRDSSKELSGGSTREVAYEPLSFGGICSFVQCAHAQYPIRCPATTASKSPPVTLSSKAFLQGSWDPEGSLSGWGVFQLDEPVSASQAVRNLLNRLQKCPQETWPTPGHARIAVRRVDSPSMPRTRPRTVRY